VLPILHLQGQHLGLAEANFGFIPGGSWLFMTNRCRCFAFNNVLTNDDLGQVDTDFMNQSG
jgi:hypothetical protein